MENTIEETTTVVAAAEEVLCIPEDAVAPVTGVTETPVAIVEAEAAEAEEAAAPVTGVTEDDTTSDDSASLPSDHLEGSDDEAEEDEAEEAEETEGLRRRHTGEVPPPTPSWPPMPSSPLRLQRQVGASLSPLHGGVEAGVLEEAMDRIRLLEAGPVEVPPGEVPVPVWLFLAAIVVLMVYLTAVAYLLSWQCGVKAGP